MMLAVSKSRSSSACTYITTTTTSASSSDAGLELDPLLKDLSEKRQTFQKGVLSLASDLKDARARLAKQEEYSAREAKTRKATEIKAKHMEEHIFQLQKILDERDGQLQASTMSAEQFLKDLDNLRSELSTTQAAADTSAALTQSTQAQCSSLMEELEKKNSALKEQEDRVNKLEEQLNLLQQDLQSRELSQKQLKEEVIRIEQEIMLAVANASSKDNELIKILEEVSPKNFENINKHLSAKDEEIVRLREEIRCLSAHWNLKTKELQSQLEKHQRTDQELKKRVFKLEFCLQEARAQTKKLQRMGEKRDNALKELKDQLAMQQHKGSCCGDQHKIWESKGFKIIASMSMLVLVVFARR